MALTPGFQLPFGIQPLNPIPVDSWSGPYEGLTLNEAVAAANASIPSAVRFQTMEVRLVVNGVAKKYWYKYGVADSDLTEFSDTIPAVGMFTTSVSAPAISGVFYGDGSKLTGINGLATTNAYTSGLSAVNIYNTGDVPALYIGNSGSGHIASFYDLNQDIEMLHVGGASGLRPNIGIKTSSPNKTLTVVGEISATEDITTSGSFRGDGSQLTGVVKTQYTPPADATFTSSVSAPTIRGMFYGDGSNLTGLPGSYTPPADATFTSSVSAPALSGVHYGDGSQLTGVVKTQYTPPADATFTSSVSAPVLYGDGSNLTGVKDTTKLPLSGGLITGDLTILGSVSAAGPVTFVGNTVFSSTSALSVVNISPVGTVPALYVGQSGSGDIASFYDIDQNTEVLHIGGANGTHPNVGIKTSAPNKTLTVAGEISATGDITTSGSFKGDGSQLTGVLPADAVFSSTVTTGTFYGDGSQLTGVVKTQYTPPANATFTSSVSAPALSGVHYGDGSNLTGLIKALPADVTFSSSVSAPALSGVHYGDGSNLTGTIDVTKLPLAGGIITGNLTVIGELSAAGPVTFVSNTVFASTSGLSVVNVSEIGDRPALYLGNSGPGSIASFYDLNQDIEILHIGGASGLAPNVGIKTSVPNKTLTVVGEISATEDITTSGSFKGDGSQLTGVVKTQYTPPADATFTSSVSAPALSGVFYGDGSKLTGLPGAYTPPANATFTSSVSAPALSGVHYGDGSNLTGVVKTQYTPPAEAEFATSVTAPIFYGDGSFLTGVLTELPADATFSSSVSAPAVSGVFYGDGSKLTGLPSVYVPPADATFSSSVSAPALSGVFYGDGSNLTGIRDTNKLPLSGGLLAGDLVVSGSISAAGPVTFVGNTVISTTSGLSVTNITPLGNSPAFYVGNSGPSTVASFYDLDQGIEVLHVGGINGLYPNVGINTSTPNKSFTVVGEISATEDITTSGSFYGDASKLTDVLKALPANVTFTSSVSAPAVSGVFYGDGSNLSGVIKTQYVLVTATPSLMGGVIPDGSSILVDKGLIRTNTGSILVPDSSRPLLYINQITSLTRKDIVARNYTKIIISEDGVRQLAITSGSSNAYYSSNSGKTWSALAAAKTHQDIAMSDDGKTQYAATNFGLYARNVDVDSFFYNSFGPYGNTSAVATNNDGSIVVASIGNALYKILAADPGAAVELTGAGSRAWTSIAISSDVQTIYAVAGTGTIYYSLDGGANWNTYTYSSSDVWRKITTSSNGQYVVAVGPNKPLMYSTNYLQTGNQRRDTRNWSDVSMSRDGKVIAAAVNGGKIYQSYDYGNTWSVAGDSTDQNWTSVAVAPYGAAQAAVTNNTSPLPGIYAANYNTAYFGLSAARTIVGLSAEIATISSSNFLGDGSKLAGIITKDGGTIFGGLTSTSVSALNFYGNGGTLTNVFHITGGTISQYLSAPALSGVHYGDGSNLSGVIKTTTLASSAVLGGVKPDEVSIKINGNGIIRTDLVSALKIDLTKPENNLKYLVGSERRETTSGRTYSSMAISRDGQTVYVAERKADGTTGRIRQSTDGGVTWAIWSNAVGSFEKVVSNVDSSIFVYLYTYNNGPRYLVLGNGNYLLNNNSYPVDNVWQDVAVSYLGNYIAVASNYGLYVSTNYGSTFALKKSGNIQAVACATVYLFIAQEGQIYTSSNGGTTWTNPTGSINSIPWVTSPRIVCSGNGNYVLFGCAFPAKGIWFSADRGVSYTKIAFFGDGTMLDASISHNGQRMIVSLGSGAGIYASYDYGTTWTLIPGSNGYDSVATWETLDSTRVYFANTNGIYRSTHDLFYESLSASRGFTALSGNFLNEIRTSKGIFTNSVSAPTGLFTVSVNAATYYGDGSQLTGVIKTQYTPPADATFTSSVSAPALSGVHYGDGSKLTGLPSTYTPPANATFTSSVSAPAVSGVFYGDGSKLTGLPATYTPPADATFTSSVSAPALSGVHYGDGSKLTGLPSTYTPPANATFTSSVSAPALSGVFYGDGSFLTGLPATYTPPANATFTSSVSAPALSGVFYGDGSQLTGVIKTQYTPPANATFTSSVSAPALSGVLYGSVKIPSGGTIVNGNNENILQSKNITTGVFEINSGGTTNFLIGPTYNNGIIKIDTASQTVSALLSDYGDACPIGTTVTLINIGTNTVIVNMNPGDSGNIISRNNYRHLVGVASVATIIKTNTGEWIVTGTLTE